MTVRNTVFEASAGTGKTHQVTTLYNALILGEPFPAEDGIAPAGAIFSGGEEHKVDCQKILMLTFARPAAAEMRVRITEHVENALANAEPDDQQKYWRILRALSGAQISTIHAFAQRLLLENAVLAGISPSVQLIEEDEKEAFFNEVAEELLLQELGDENSDLAPTLAGLCQMRGTQQVLETVAMLIDKCRSRAIDLTPALVGDYVATFDPPQRSDIDDLFAHVDKDVKQLRNSGTEVYANAKPFYDALCAIQESLPADADSVEVSKAALALQKEVKNNWFKLKPAREYAAQKLGAMLAYEASRELQRFLQFAAKCAEAYKAKKDEQGLLDFDDMILKALDLVKRDGASGVVPAFEVIIVDEAQDNSWIQNELIKTVQDVTGAKVILCGDPKQSIYTWRAADPGGMMKFAAVLGDVLKVPLKTSYRSQKDMVCWINSIAAHDKVLGENYTDAARLMSRDIAETTKGPNVELLLPDWECGEELAATVSVPGKKSKKQPETEKKYLFELTKKDLRSLAGADIDDREKWQAALDQYDQRNVMEARAIARRIKLLCTEGADQEWRPAQLWDDDERVWKDSGDDSRYKYRDILILLRAATKQGLYEAALREQGIRYTTNGKGRGFFFRQEVKDIASLLRCLAFQTDDVALTAVLRSPFISLSDAAIALLSKSEKTGKLSGRLLRYSMRAGPDRVEQIAAKLGEAHLENDVDAYRRGVKFLDELGDLAGRTTTIELARQAIRLTGYDAVLAGGFHGAQKLANMRKLLSMVHDVERRENMDLQSIAKWLGDAIEEVETPDAVVFDPEDDAVKISTVHAAKGLTSPVVFIPDLRRTPRDNDGWFTIYEQDDAEGYRIAADLRLADAAGDAVNLVTTDLDAARESSKAMRAAEAQRLFYVGVTRPRDLIVLSGESGTNDSAWRSWINEYLKSIIATGDAEDRQLIGCNSYGRVAQAMRDLVGKKDHESPVVDAKEIRRAEEAVAHAVCGEEYRLPVTILTKVPRWTISAGVGADIDESVRKFRRTSLVGLSDMVRSVDESAGVETVTTIDYAARGTIGHAVLENLGYGTSVDLETGIEQEFSRMRVDKRMADSLRPCLSKAAEFLAKEFAGAEHIIREMPFCATFTHDGATCFVDGKIDLIYFKDGAWHIVDYKFADQDEAHLIETYALQLLVYRDAISVEAGGGSRTIRLEESSGPAPVDMTLLGVAKDGAITRAQVDPGISSEETARDVMEAARLIVGKRSTSVA